MNDDATLPPNFKDTVEDTRDLLNGLIDRIADVAGDAGQRWIDGFERKDVTAVTTNLGDKLTEQAEQAWDTAQSNVIPPKKGTN